MMGEGMTENDTQPVQYTETNYQYSENWPNRSTIFNLINHLNNEHLPLKKDGIPIVYRYPGNEEEGSYDFFLSNKRASLNTFFAKQLIQVGHAVAENFVCDNNKLSDIAIKKRIVSNNEDNRFTLVIDYYATQYNRDTPRVVIDKNGFETRINEKRIICDDHRPLLTLELEFEPFFKRLNVEGKEVESLSHINLNHIKTNTSSLLSKAMPPEPTSSWNFFAPKQSPQVQTVSAEERTEKAYQSANKILEKNVNQLREIKSKKVKELNEKKSEIAQLQEDNQKLRQTIADEKQSKEAIIEELGAQTEERVVSQVAALKSKMDELNGNYGTLNQAHEALILDYQTMQGNQASLQAANKDLVAEIEQLNDNHQNLTQAHEALILDYQTMKGNQASLQAANKDLVAEIAQLKEQLQSEQASNSNLKSSLEEANNNIDELNNIISKLKKTIRNLKNKIDGLNIKIEKLYKYITLAAQINRITIDDIKNQFSDKKNQFNHLFNELQNTLNRSFIYDIKHAIVKPFKWIYRKLTRGQAPLSPSAPEFAPSLNDCEKLINSLERVANSRQSNPEISTQSQQRPILANFNRTETSPASSVTRDTSPAFLIGNRSRRPY